MSRMKNGLAAAAFLLVACGQAGPGGGAADAKGTETRQRKLDLAGLTIGMGVSQATAALKAAGWSVKQFPGRTWEQDVNNELARQNVSGRSHDYDMKGVGELLGTKGDERVSVTLAAAPSPMMGRVREVQYTAPAVGQTPEQLMAGLTGKYGPPDRVGATGLRAGGTWCAGGLVCAGGRGFGSRTYLLAGFSSLSGGVVIRLSEGGDAKDARNAELRRATSGAVGPRGKASY